VSSKPCGDEFLYTVIYYFFRGTMDASAFVSKEQWEDILAKNLCDEVDIRCEFFFQ